MKILSKLFIAVPFLTSWLTVAGTSFEALADETPVSKERRSDELPPIFKSGTYLGVGYGVGAHDQSIGITGFTFAFGYNFLPAFQAGFDYASATNPFDILSDRAYKAVSTLNIEAFYSPGGGEGLMLGAKTGPEFETIRDDFGYYSSSSGWAIGPALGYEFKIERRTTLGLEGDYLIALTNAVPDLALFEAFFKIRF